MKGSNFKLLSNILRGAWYMHPDKAFAQMPLVEKLISGEIVFEEGDNKAPTMEIINLKGGRSSFQNNLDEVPEGSIALINVRGSLMKEDYCGDPGMSSMGKLIAQADGHENIKGTILIIDSPGGTVDGTEAFSKLIRSTTKPIVGFVDGTAASAAYWAASSTNHIMLSGETAEVGSIGTMFGFRDYTKFLEDKGIKEHLIFATKSTEKWASYLEARDGKYDKIKNEELDPLNEVFLSSVKSQRPQLSDDQLKGTVYFGSNAVRLSLADSIGTLEDAVAKVIELSGNGEGAGATANHIGMPFDSEMPKLSQAALDLAKPNTNNSNINKTEKEMFNSKLDKAVDKVAAKVKAGEEILAEDVAPVNAELQAKGLEGYAIANEEEIDAVQTANDNLTADKADLETKLEASEKEVERLGALPGVQHTEANKDGGDTAHGGGEPEVISQTDADAAKLDAELAN